MSQGLSRRGFARAAGVGVAALCFPSLARATPPLVLVPRWEYSPRALDVRLYVRTADGAAAELLAYAIEVRADLRAGDSRHELALQSRGLLDQRISRSGARLERRIVLPAGDETRYDSFTAQWPAGFTGEGTLALRTALRSNLTTSSDADVAALASLVGLTLEVPVTRRS